MKLRKTILSLILLSFLSSASLFAQREADNWIFGKAAGLNFSSGYPEQIFIEPYVYNTFHGTVMSDSLGNILFSFDGHTVWNRNDEVMLNGSGFLPEHGAGWQNVIAFPKPNSTSQYYIFSTTQRYFPDGIYYSVIDMTLDGGLGGVTPEKNIKLEASGSSSEKLFVLKNEKGDGYWVVTRLFDEDRFASFKVTAAGVDPVPVYSSTGIYRDFPDSYGFLKVSPNKKYLISCYWPHDHTTPLVSFEVCSFDAESGFVDFHYLISRPDLHRGYWAPMGCEFSPDSKFLYVAYVDSPTSSGHALFQFDLSLIDDSSAFYNSGLQIMENCGHEIQLSNDGKIYSSCLFPCDAPFDEFVGVINKPWVLGTGCDYDTLGFHLLSGRLNGWHLVNILLDYLYRFEWEADDYCQGTAVHFIPHFVPTPDSVLWFFDEFAPGNYSSELSPTYTFQNPGVHEVEVDIWYPTGRYEHTSREIEIYPVPQPDLGPDLTICEGNTVTLNANCEADLYSWSTGQFGSPTITVSDSGTYWVHASFAETGCMGSDDIHISLYPAITMDESALEITPTACSGASGSITGLQVMGSPPFTFLWEDLSGNDFGIDIDVYNLPAGQYVLTVTDGNGCEQSPSTYTIDDAGNLQVLQVQTTSPHCFRPDGQLIIFAFSPSGSTLDYSINGGNNYSSDSIFTDLPAGTYIVRIRDINGCDGFYIGNPLILSDIPGPQVQPPIVTDETDFLGNGLIEITATGSTPQIFYSIDNGSTWQTNNGTFENLICGIYYVVIKDENGCDTTFTVEIENIILTYLQAITGPGEHCLGDAVTIPIEVENFKSVATFRLKLSYNSDNLQCEGYTNADPQLQQNLNAWVDQAAGQITFQWQDTVALTFNQPDTVAELVFTTKQPGSGDVGWYTGATESYFENISGSSIPAEFHTGEVTIYDPPSVILSASKTVCEGQAVSFMSIASGNQPPFTFQWTYPDGTITTSDPFFFNVNQSQAGDYILQATDQVGCTDQKSINLVVSENPVAAFHGTDTLTVQAGYLLEAGAGLASYLWNTGDTAESIIINTEGLYKVQLESPAGCQGADSIYILLKTEEIPSYHIYFPNAFTPDGDGLNDTFKAIATGDYITKFNMQIYDRWGGLIFNSDDISIGWDGKKNGNPCPGGVYAYKIIFSIDGVQGNQERVGTVALIR